jgi:hypothetical protein
MIIYNLHSSASKYVFGIDTSESFSSMEATKYAAKIEFEDIYSKKSYNSISNADIGFKWIYTVLDYKLNFTTVSIETYN